MSTSSENLEEACDLFCHVHKRLGHVDYATRESFFAESRYPDAERRRRAWVEIAEAVKDRPPPDLTIDDLAYALFRRVHEALGDLSEYAISREAFDTAIPGRNRAWCVIAAVAVERKTEVSREEE